MEDDSGKDDSGKYDVLDLSRYIINSLNERGYNITNLRLQKILCYLYKEYLDITGKYLFKENIITDKKYGPIIPSVYNNFRIYGRGRIPSISYYSEIKFQNTLPRIGMKRFDDNFLDDGDKKWIDKVIKKISSRKVNKRYGIAHRRGFRAKV